VFAARVGGAQNEPLAQVGARAMRWVASTYHFERFAELRVCT
jgi:hypothetical protein